MGQDIYDENADAAGFPAAFFFMRLPAPFFAFIGVSGAVSLFCRDLRRASERFIHE